MKTLKQVWCSIFGHNMIRVARSEAIINGRTIPGYEVHRCKNYCGHSIIKEVSAR